MIKGIVLPTPILKSVGRRAGGSNVSILKHWPNCRIFLFVFLDLVFCLLVFVCFLYYLFVFCFVWFLFAFLFFFLFFLHLTTCQCRISNGKIKGTHKVSNEGTNIIYTSTTASGSRAVSVRGGGPRA